LYAIIGLNSMPTMQCGQRMIKVVSVRVGIGRPAHEQYRKARKIPDAMPSDPAENHKDRWEPHGYRTESCADIWAGVPTVRQITLDFEAYLSGWENGGKTGSGCD